MRDTNVDNGSKTDLNLEKNGTLKTQFCTLNCRNLFGLDSSLCGLDDGRNGHNSVSVGNAMLIGQ